MSKIYLIPGIGCAKTIFEKLTPPSGYSFVFVPWIEPKKNESFDQYCLRMVFGVTFEEKDVVLGVSLGGMVAQVLAQKYPQLRPIVVSSCVTTAEFSPFLRFVKRFSLHKIVPVGLFTFPVVASFLITGSIKKRHVASLKHLLCGMSKEYFRFMTEKVINFNSPLAKNEGVMRIQGSRDALFPVKTLTTKAHIIKGATHLAVYTHGKVVSEVLAELLS